MPDAPQPNRIRPDASGLYIAVAGPGRNVEHKLLELAEQVGRLIAETGATLLSGGLGGVMAAASKGASERGGQAIGLLPGTERADANPYLSVALATGLGEMRNALLVRCADVVIAVGGSWGTLSEVALALRLDKPVVALHGWSPGHTHPRLKTAGSPTEALTLALELHHGCS
jgi:uncharacterized protein (TIGR00725 family)